MSVVTSTLASMTFKKITADLLLPQVLHALLEAIINKALSLNINNVSLSHLQQKTLTLELTELATAISFTIAEGNVLVSANVERSDCTIQTSIKTLTKLKAQQQLTDLIKQGELDVVGDIKVAQQFASLAEQLEIDWQSELASYIGDVPTHKLLHFGNKITEKVKYTIKQLESDVNEYIVHEKRLVVTSSQIAAFNQGVEQISAHVDNLSARVNQLMANLPVDINAKK